MNNLFDSLDPSQAEELTEGIAEKRIGAVQRRRIARAVRQKAGMKRRGFFTAKNLAICGAAVAAVIISFAVIGFDKVAASISKIFTFIPGYGISKGGEESVYTAETIVGSISSGGAEAVLLNAMYSDGVLSATVSVEGKNLEVLDREDVKLFIDGTEAADGSVNGSVAWNGDSVMIGIGCEVKNRGQSVYEFRIKGFDGGISFRLVPCESYEKLSEIGPTDIRNGISVTAVPQKIGSSLYVWCYPNMGGNTDHILGYGVAVNSAWNEQRYLEAGGEKFFTQEYGWVLTHRLGFTVPEDLRSAVLHIPYLSMSRDEKIRLKIKLPENYGKTPCDYELECSLGKIKITEIERQEASEGSGAKDCIMLRVEFQNNDENRRLYFFDFSSSDGFAYHTNSENGCLEYMELEADKDRKELELDIRSLNYYLMGEYEMEIELE